MRTKPLLSAVVIAGLVAALGSFAMAWRSAGGQRHLVPYSAHVSGVPAVTTLTGAGPRRAAGSPSPPVRVVIAAIGLSARVVPVGLTRSGTWQMPPPSSAGWYRWGPAPGARGPAVLVGHVDSDRGPAAFYRLSGVRP